MKVKGEEFKKACKTILQALDTKQKTVLTDTLQIESVNDELRLYVTNREYGALIKFKLDENATLKASVNANLFLKLISKLTTDEIELLVEGNSLKVIGNGTYYIPMIYNNDKLLELPIIDVTRNITNEQHIKGSILHSIANYNSKELLRGNPTKAAGRYYYIDNHGAITFTTGACVNSFELEKPVKILLKGEVVRLFKLFDLDEEVMFKMNQEEVNGVVQTRVEFSNDHITLTAIVPKTAPDGSELIEQVPVHACREMTSKAYDYSVVVDRIDLISAIERIMLVNEDNIISSVKFSDSKLVLGDDNNREEIKYLNDCPSLKDYTMTVNIYNLKTILDGSTEQHMTINFGDHHAVVIKKHSVVDLLPEARMR